MRHTQPINRVSEYKLPRRIYVLWWAEVTLLLIITVGATLLRALREPHSANAA